MNFHAPVRPDPSSFEAKMGPFTQPPPSESPISKSTRFDLSVIVPAMNEEETISVLHDRIIQTCAGLNRTVQIIFVDDGSSDQTWKRMATLANQQETATPSQASWQHETKAIRFRRNFGKAAALDAGFSIATGKIVLTMDADLQDDPDEIPRFIEAIEGTNSENESPGFDVVSGWKRVRHDPWHKVLPSRVFNAMVSGLTGVRLHDHNCGFKAYRHEVTREVDLYGERHRFIPVLAAARGWTVGEIEVQHHAREHGQSKYGVSRLMKGFLDLLSIYLVTGYGRRPLHLIGSAGAIFFGAGAMGMMYLTALKVFARLSPSMDEVHLHTSAIFYYCICAILLGAQFLIGGLLAELIVSVAASASRDQRSSGTSDWRAFSVSETAGIIAENDEGAL